MPTNQMLRRARKYASHLDIDDALELLGPQRRRPTIVQVLPMIGTLLAGALIGAGLGLLFAPSSGRLLRRDAERRVSGIKERIRDGSSPVPPVA